MQTPSIFSTLPPAGPPLPFLTLAKSIASAFLCGNIEENLIDELKTYFKTQHIFLTDSGRSGLSLAFMALHNLVSESEKSIRNEILIPAYVSYSVPSAVAHAGFKIRFYDIDSHTLAPDYESMQSAVSEKTLAIVLCHQFGLPFDATKAKQIASSVGAYTIDDAAQVMGGKVHDSYAGTMGDIGLFSLSRGKPLTSVEGGVVLTNSAQISASIDASIEKVYNENYKTKSQNVLYDMKNIIKACALYVLKKPVIYTLPASMPFLNIGASIFEPEFADNTMSKYRMNLLKECLPLLEKANEERRKKAMQYTRFLDEVEHLRSIELMSDVEPIYLRYPIIPTQGNEICIQKILQDKDGKTSKKLGISRGFPLPLYAVKELMPYLGTGECDMTKAQEKYAGATYLAKNLLTLPTHDQVKDADFELIKSFLNQHKI